jgi:hypothetical protein
MKSHEENAGGTEIDVNNICGNQSRVSNPVLRELTLLMIQAVPGLTFMPLHALHVKITNEYQIVPPDQRGGLLFSEFRLCSRPAVG